MNIRDVTQVALECRDERCHWTRDRKLDVREPMWGTYRWDSCANGCGNWRCAIERSDGTIDPASRSYEHGVKYLAALQFSREECRRELNRREHVKTRTVVVRGARRGKTNLRVVA